MLFDASRLRPVLCGIALALSARAWSHDTWFEPLPSPPGRNGVAFALGTGVRFPVQESPIHAEHIARAGCRGAQGESAALREWQQQRHAVWLRTPIAPAAQPSCWAQVAPVDITLEPDIVALYLKEVNAPRSVVDAWKAQRARGVAWRERYEKHARVELLQPGVPVATRPAPMGMDVLLSSEAPVAPGNALTLQVLRDGQPLPNLAVELQHAASALGVWRQTDAQGRIRFTPTLPGRWLLRGTELRLSDTQPDLWVSRFVTLAFEVPASGVQ